MHTKETLYLAIPTMGWLSTELAGWIKVSKVEPNYTSRITPVSHARNAIVADFLKSNKSALLMIDADTVPPVNAIDTLLELLNQGYDVVSGITSISRGGVAIPNVYRDYADVEKNIPYSDLPKEPFKIVGAGASCLLIDRKVFLEIEMPYFKSIEYDNGALCSEDLYFCEQVIKSRNTIMAHPGVRCGHVKEICI